MIRSNSINGIFSSILNDVKYEKVTNEFCVWKDMGH